MVVTRQRQAAASGAPAPSGSDPEMDLHTSSGADDDSSLDAYGESDDEQAPQTEANGENDDYAKTFDSPSQAEAQNEGNEEAPQPVSNATVAMTSSQSPEAMPDHSLLAQPEAAVVPSPSTDEIAASPSAHAEDADPSHLPPASSTDLVAPEPLQAKPSDADTNASTDAGAPAHAGTVDVGSTSNGHATSTIDLDKLVEDIAAQAESSLEQPSPSASTMHPPPAIQASPLPPKPNQSAQPAHAGAEAGRATSNGPPAPSGEFALPVNPSQSHVIPASIVYAASGPPGTSIPLPASLPPPPSPGFGASQGTPSLPPTPSFPNSIASQPPGSQALNSQQDFDAFLEDERRYTAEARWERFPEGSRIFVGNLSQERVTKKHVFDVFSAYGRLAQISMKSAYGFVQYHTAADAAAAMQNLEGHEIRGRKIHIEVSKTQKREKDRDKSPDRNKNRSGRATDRYDGREQGNRRNGRDDYRPDQADSPGRRDDRRRGDDHGRGRGSQNNSGRQRARSRSPRYGNEPYRQRSRSPHHRRSGTNDQDDGPRRQGPAPDVQLILMQELHHDFLGWVQRGFQERGLRSDIMFVNPRFPIDSIIQNQVRDGVHAVSQLDIKAQNMGKIPLQVFDRTNPGNVQFSKYEDLDPTTAADLVLRVKGAAVAPPPAAYQPPVSNPYGPSYPPAHSGYPSAYPPAYPSQPPPAGPNVQDLSAMLQHLDPATLQKVLASVVPPTNSYPPHHGAAMPAHVAGVPQYGGHPSPAPPQVDINALLGKIKTAAGGAPPAMPAHGAYGTPGYGAPNGGHPANSTPRLGGPSGQSVESIMAQMGQYQQRR